MQSLKIIALLLLAFALETNADTQYRLSSGDVVRIYVYGEPDLSFEEIRLNDAGTFSYPFIGEVNALNKTPREIENMIIDGLKDGFIVDPRVSVSMINYREFYISGEVNSPGGYPFQPGLTLDRAIALAGGLTERASKRRITIIRGGDDSRTIEKAALDSAVKPGDTITIDQGFF
ncbi:polysaccharide biosynthesis/export family protein [Halopseudomonas pelagia]|uniref:polysaccharide biosynthesis/export family protein n=1 Tax=Halopseudomonas pelagia TaxID=553151 RepID=UPI00039A836D|nr:polysaccharide biosynthesis/export family protein [Halopseudomonas pelagia]|tara:strand:+ start:570 stop:1094 length:525 start_codon:yes stop_codon:yes gene_type:complete